MICGVHAFIGAALGKLLKSKKPAFLAGVVTHFFADLLPHRDLSIETEVALVSGALAAIGTSQGWNSPAFWGAVGGVIPDVENLISQTRGGRNLFPSHTGLHGPKVTELVSQAAIVLLCLAVLSGNGSEGPESRAWKPFCNLDRDYRDSSLRLP